MMRIGTFRRNAVKTLTTKATKRALRMVSKNTARTQLVQATVSLKGHTGQLLQTMTQYLLGLPQTQEMKTDAFMVLGDIGYDLTLLARVLKVKVPSSTKKSKLVGTRGAAILQLDSCATDLLKRAQESLFVGPAMTSTKKIVSLPQQGGAKEERDVDVVDLVAEQAAEAERQIQMRSFLTGAIDVFWRLCFDMTGQPPVEVLDAKFKRMVAEFPDITTFDSGEKKVAVTATSKKKPGKKPGKKTKPEAVSA